MSRCHHGHWTVKPGNPLGNLKGSFGHTIGKTQIYTTGAIQDTAATRHQPRLNDLGKLRAAPSLTGQLRKQDCLAALPPPSKASFKTALNFLMDRGRGVAGLGSHFFISRH